MSEISDGGMDRVHEEMERLGRVSFLFDAVAARMDEAAEAHMIDTQQAHMQLDRDPDTGQRLFIFGLAENFEEWVANQGDVLVVRVPIPEIDEEEGGEERTRLLRPDNPDRHFSFIWYRGSQQQIVKVTASGIEGYPDWADEATPDGKKATIDEQCWDLFSRLSFYDHVPIRKRRLSA